MKTKEDILKIAEIEELDPFDVCYRYYYLTKHGYDLLKEEIDDIKSLSNKIQVGENAEKATSA